MKKLTTNNLQLTTKKGMSLIELIIYISIVAIVLVAITDLATRLVFAQNKTNKGAAVSENLNFAQNKISQDIENATAITGTYPSNTLYLRVNNHDLKYDLSNGVITLSRDGQPLSGLPITSSAVTVTPPNGVTGIFTKITNGTSNTVQIQMQFSLKSDPSQKQTAQTAILMRGK